MDANGWKAREPLVTGCLVTTSIAIDKFLVVKLAKRVCCRGEAC